jgi:hypothetical protein
MPAGQEADLREAIQQYDETAQTPPGGDQRDDDLKDLQTNIISGIQGMCFNGERVDRRSVKELNNLHNLELETKGPEVGITLRDMDNPERTNTIWIGHDYVHA